MAAGLFQASIQNRGIILDPQTKFLLLITMSIFVLGGAGVEITGRLMPLFCAIITVSEFTAAMLRIHVSEKIIIPLSVMFRFFPTVLDEFHSINTAMKMRGIQFGRVGITKMIEYRLVSLMTCYAKIGEELSAAALTRGLGGDAKRTNICKIGFHLQDYLVVPLCLIPYMLLLLQLFGFYV